MYGALLQQSTERAEAAAAVAVASVSSFELDGRVTFFIDFFCSCESTR